MPPSNRPRRYQTAPTARGFRAQHLTDSSHLHREHAIGTEPRVETRLLESRRNFARHVAARRQLVRRPSVVEQTPARFEHARELAIEGPGIQLAGDAEARRIVQHRIELTG